MTPRRANLLLAAAFVCGAMAASTTRAATPVGAAQVFSPEVISSATGVFAPAFSPDSSTVLFSRKSGPGIAIMISQRDGEGWSTPRVAPFSGRWVDLESALSEDGSYLIFASDRPIADGAGPLKARYGGGEQGGGNLWRTDLVGETWSEPKRLPASVNDSASIWTPSLARNGDLYFMRTDDRTGRFRLHKASAKGGDYAPARSFAFSTGAFNDVDPAIDPDERFLVFSSDRGQPGTGEQAGPERLFIAFDPEGPAPLVCPLTVPGWEAASRSQVEARFSRDGRTLYFASKGKIWMTPMNAALWSAGSASAACRVKAL